MEARIKGGFVHRIKSELGKHAGVPARAMTKQEVAAALCRIGIQAGFWSIPEFEIECAENRYQRIDVVWAERNTRPSGSLWEPVAAFEIEGHDVDGSILKNAKSLTAAGNEGATVLAMVLFQIAPDRERWHPSAQKGQQKSESRAKEILEKHLKDLVSPYSVEVVLDEQLVEKMESWLQVVRQRPVATE
jgi:hypothetical protein